MNPNPREVLLCGVVLASALAMGCRPPNDNSERGRSGGKVSTSKSTESRKPAPPPAPVKREVPPPATPASKSVIHEVVRSPEPFVSINEADELAVREAQKVIAVKLALLNPPIRQAPPLSAVREQFLVKGSQVVRRPNEDEQAILDRADLDPDRKKMYVEYTVDVKEDQLRQLRMYDRIVDALRVAGGIFVVALAGFLFLRADDWTRGYLTSWLGLLAGLGVIGGLVAVLTLGSLP